MVGASALIFAGHHYGHFLLSMIFGALFLIDGLLQCVSAWVVRYRRWHVALAWGVAELLIAVFFFQPYPTHYVGTLPYGLGLFLFFGGLNMLTLAARVRRLAANPALRGSSRPGRLPEPTWRGSCRRRTAAATLHRHRPPSTAPNGTGRPPTANMR